LRPFFAPLNKPGSLKPPQTVNIQPITENAIIFQPFNAGFSTEGLLTNKNKPICKKMTSQEQSNHNPFPSSPLVKFLSFRLIILNQTFRPNAVKFEKTPSFKDGADGLSRRFNTVLTSGPREKQGFSRITAA
jgi:hypothetical protein